MAAWAEEVDVVATTEDWATTGTDDGVTTDFEVVRASEGTEALVVGIAFVATAEVLTTMGVEEIALVEEETAWVEGETAFVEGETAWVEVGTDAAEDAGFQTAGPGIM